MEASRVGVVWKTSTCKIASLGFCWCGLDPARREKPPATPLFEKFGI